MVFIHEIGFFHGHRGLDRVLSMKLAFFMDIEVWTGCLSMKLAFFMDIEV